MMEDHILNGDYIVVEPTQVANPGEIVVALVGGDEATLKRFYREPGGQDSPAAGQFRNAADHRACRRREDSGPRGRRAAQILIR